MGKALRLARQCQDNGLVKYWLEIVKETWICELSPLIESPVKSWRKGQRPNFDLISCNYFFPVEFFFRILFHCFSFSAVFSFFHLSSVLVQICRRIHAYLSFHIYLSDILHFSFLMHLTSKRGPCSFM